jgi:hypothetical protein
MRVQRGLERCKCAPSWRRKLTRPMLNQLSDIRWPCNPRPARRWRRTGPGRGRQRTGGVRVSRPLGPRPACRSLRVDARISGIRPSELPPRCLLPRPVCSSCSGFRRPRPPLPLVPLSRSLAAYHGPSADRGTLPRGLRESPQGEGASPSAPAAEFLPPPDVVWRPPPFEIL